MSTQIHFITWPSGNVFEGTQSSVDQRWSIHAAIRSFLPEAWFPGVNFSHYSFGAGGELWRAMEKAGFKAQSINLPEEMANGVSR